jgi:hypothetical protein
MLFLAIVANDIFEVGRPRRSTIVRSLNAAFAAGTQPARPAYFPPRLSPDARGD